MNSRNEARLGAIEQRIAKSYRANRESCKRCQRYCEKNGLQLHGPLSFFNIGDQFENDRYKVVFVGKNHWYSKTDVEEMGFLAPSRFRDARAGGLWAFLYRQSIYWRCIQDIAKMLYPEEEVFLLDHISITNLTKCNTSSGYRDTTPYYMTDNCVEIFQEEMKALRPQHLVFLTGRNYDSYIGSLDFGYAIPPEDVTGQAHKRAINSKHRVWWWHRVFHESDRITMHVLRTRHPQGAPKALVTEIANWVQRRNPQTA